MAATCAWETGLRIRLMQVFHGVFYPLQETATWRWLEIHLFPVGNTNDSFMVVHFPASCVRALPEDANSFARKLEDGLKRMLIQSRGITILFCSIIFYQPLMDSITFSEYDENLGCPHCLHAAWVFVDPTCHTEFMGYRMKPNT